MDIDSAIEKRHSTRSFLPKKVSWKLVLEAVDSANKAPFAGNMNHLKFLIIEDEKKIDKLAELSSQLWINTASIVVVVCSDDTYLENQYGERGRVYSRQEAGAAIQNFLLKLTDLGLSSCWVGAYTDELVKQLLSIPSHIQIEAIIPIGYEKKEKGKKEVKKKDLENVLYWEKWKQDKRDKLIADPDIYLQPK